MLALEAVSVVGAAAVVVTAPAWAKVTEFERTKVLSNTIISTRVANVVRVERLLLLTGNNALVPFFELPLIQNLLPSCRRVFETANTTTAAEEFSSGNPGACPREVMRFYTSIQRINYAKKCQCILTCKS